MPSNTRKQASEHKKPLNGENGNESKDDEDFILSLYRKLSNEDKEKIRKTISALVA